MLWETNLPHVQIYSDGWANPNPWVWWYGIILCYKGVIKELYQGFQMTTNNRMELLGVIMWLSQLKKKSRVDIYTDSQYTIHWIQKWWAQKWKENNWYRTKSEKAVNYDLWERLLDLVEQHEVEFHWVKGHNGHIENERCDELATLSMSMENLLVDDGYIEKSATEQMSLDSSTKVESTKQKKLLANTSMKVEKNWDPCKKCMTPVEKRIPKHTQKTLLKAYYYEYYLTCPSCKTNYMLEAAKRDIKTLKL